MQMSALYAPLLLSGAAFLICIVSVFYIRSYLRKRTSKEWILSEIQEEVNELLKDIDEATERDISLIKERENELKALLEEIDKRLKVYIREMDKRREAEDAYAALLQKQVNKPVMPAKSESYQELGKNRYRLHEGAEPPESAETGPAFPIPGFNLKQDDAAPPSVGEQIRQLLRAGFSPAAIASRLGISIAEVELASVLYKS